MAEWLFGLLEVVMVALVALGAGLIVLSIADGIAAIGAGLVVAGLLGGVLVVAAQVPEKGGGADARTTRS